MKKEIDDAPETLQRIMKIEGATSWQRLQNNNYEIYKSDKSAKVPFSLINKIENMSGTGISINEYLMEITWESPKRKKQSKPPRRKSVKR